MKIAVCFKALADFTRLSASDWRWDDRYIVDTHFVRNIFNCYEESALEMSLKLAETCKTAQDKAELTALTVDDSKADLFLKHLMAVGYEKAIRIQCPEQMDLRFNPLAVSHLIARYIEQQGQQMAFFGLQGAEGDNGQTGLLVAERLGWPCIREVTEVTQNEDTNCLEVTSLPGEGTLVQTVKPPMVLIIGQAPSSPRLRHPSVRQRLNVTKNQIIPITPASMGIDDSSWANSDKIVVDLMQPDQSQTVMLPEGNTPREHAQYIFDHCIKGQVLK